MQASPAAYAAVRRRHPRAKRDFHTPLGADATGRPKDSGSRNRSPRETDPPRAASPRIVHPALLALLPLMTVQGREPFPTPELGATQEIPPAGTLIGTIRVSEGIPVAAAEIFLHLEQEDGRHARTGSMTSDTDGRFELGFYGRVTVTIQARKSGVGTAALIGLELDPEDPPDEIELFLHGSGVLEGRLVDPRHSPLRGVTLHAVAADLDHVPGKDERWEHERDLGLATDIATTDAQGRFHMRGLAPGSYALCLGEHGGEREFGGDRGWGGQRDFSGDLLHSKRATRPALWSSEF